MAKRFLRPLLRAGAATALIALAGAVGAQSGGEVSYQIVDGAIPDPLTDMPGNPARGRRIVRDMGAVTCLICHRMPIPEEPDHGNIGPPLHDVGARYTMGEIRLRIVDSKALNPASVMPSYFRVEGLYRVLTRHDGQPIYSAQQVEDVVAYLATLRGDIP